MSGPIETARGGAGRDFPASWGTPPGTAYSEERSVWVRRNTRLQEALDLTKIAAREIVDEVHREANAQTLVGHLQAWADVLAKLAKSSDKVDANVVDGHLQAWAAAVAKLKHD